MGNLKINIQRGVNLAVRDIVSSDPYVVLKLGNQKMKTRVIKGNVNPEWNQSFTVSASDHNAPIKLVVYDKDTFSFDDKMGNADVDVGPFLKALKMHLKGLPEGIAVSKVEPTSLNCLTQESSIVWSGGKIVQNMILRLKNVECGELEIQLRSA